MMTTVMVVLFIVGILLVVGLALSGGFAPNARNKTVSPQKAAVSSALPPQLKPKPTPLPKPLEPLTPEWEEKFRAIAITKGRTFDMRRLDYDDPGLQDCIALARMGYLKFSESGPGGSFSVYQLTDAGRKAAREIAIKHMHAGGDRV